MLLLVKLTNVPCRFTEMERAKKAKDPSALVCGNLGNHEIFEKWRTRDATSLTGTKRDEYLIDKAESNRRSA